MIARNDGGPAFPRDHAHLGHNGMTLRDYFAAKAMAALTGTSGGPALLGLDGCEPHTAAAAYRIADAMLAAREGEKS